MLCCAVAIIPLQLKEKWSAFLFEEQEDESPSSFPQIKLTEGEYLYDEDVEIEVIVENRTVCTCGDMVTAMSLLFSLYYIFNVAYPPTQESTLLFLQKAFFQIEDGGKKNPKISRLLTTLLCR